MSTKVTDEIYKERLATLFNGALIPLECYKGDGVKINVQCTTCGYIWDVAPNYLWRKNRGKRVQCPRCSGKEKITTKMYEDRLDSISDGVYKTLESYHGYDSKTLTLCTKCGLEWRPTPHNLLNGSGCPICNVGRPLYDEEKFKSKVNKKFNNNIIMISSYDGKTSPATFKCAKCGYDWNEKKADRVLKRSGCPCCTIDLKDITHDDFVKMFARYNKFNRVLLGKYTHYKKTILVKCSICGNEWDANARGLLKNKACPGCVAVKHTITYEEFLSRLNKKHKDAITPISAYVGIRTKMWFKCNKCQYEWCTTPSSVVDRGSGCKQCLATKYEATIRDFLKDNNIKFRFNKSLPGLVRISHLKLDFFLIDYGVAIETDGVQHFRSVAKFGGDGVLQTTKDRDTFKNKWLKDKGYTLIRISDSPYKTEHHITIEQFKEAVEHAIANCNNLQDTFKSLAYQ